MSEDESAMFKTLKRLAKECAYRYFAVNEKTLIEQMQKYSVISFDVFDTLIKRDVPRPGDVFKLVESRYDKKYSVSSDFYKKRTEAEKKARLSLGVDVNFDEIYDFYDGDDKDLLKQLELNVEFDVCTPSLLMRPVFEKAIELDKEIVLISDMYLTSGVIESLLRKCGICGYKKLYVSCEIRKNKANGDLYEYVRDDLHIDKKELFHIGDSIKGDYISAKKRGMKACLINRQFNNTPYCKSKDALLMTFIQNHESRDYDECQKIGYEVLGPMIFGFALWLHDEIRKKTYDKILFLARDSELLLKAYKRIYKNDKNDKKCKYFYISRTAALNCINDLISNYEELHDLYVSKDSDTVGVLYNALNVSKDRQGRINSSLGINVETLINAAEQIDEDALLEQLELNLYEGACAQRELLKKYLKQLDVVENFAVVDVGWEGRIQWALNRIMQNDTNGVTVDGYYFGIIKKCTKLTRSLNMSSYMGVLKNTDVDARVIMESVALFETLFLSSDGRTIAYEKSSNGEIKAIKTDPDQDEENLRKIVLLQEAALTFVDDMNESVAKENISWCAENIFDIYKKFAVFPTNKVVKELRNWEFKDRDSHIFGSEHKLIYYLVHPSDFRKDISNSCYRILFLKDIFKLPLPYFNPLYKYYYLKHRERE